MVLVFDLGFGERGFARDGPVDRFFCAIDETFFDENSQGAEDFGLISRIHRHIFGGPVSENTEAFELGALDFDIIFCEFGARVPQFGGC